jgi:hypothetical protein
MLVVLFGGVVGSVKYAFPSGRWERVASSGVPNSDLNVGCVVWWGSVKYA